MNLPLGDGEVGPWVVESSVSKPSHQLADVNDPNEQSKAKR